MLKRYLSVSVFALLLAMVLVACGGTAATPEPVEEPEEEAPAEEEEMEEEPAEEEEAPAEEEEGGEEEEMAEGMSISIDCETTTTGGGIQSVTAVDDMTVEFVVCNTDPAFLEKIAFSPFHIMPSEVWEATGGTGDLLENPVGTGPYMVEEWARGESVTYASFPDYWNNDAYADRAETLVIRWNAEGAARLLELQAGTAHGIDNPSPDDFEAIEADPDLVLVDRPALNTFYVAFTNTFAPFDNVTVRQAFAQGIDRQRLVDNFYPEGSEVASHFTPCSIVNGCAGDAWYDYDLDAALAQLDEAGLGDGFETTIYYRDVFRSYLPEPGRVAEDLQAQFADMGVTAEIVVMESGAFIAEASEGRLDGIHLLGWGADYPHVTNFLDFHFGRSNTQFGDSYPEIYENLEEGFGIADPAEAEPVYAAANNAIREQVPMVPIVHGASAAAYRAEVSNPQASPLSNEWFAASPVEGSDTFVFMQNAEPISLFCYDETDGESLRPCEQATEGLYAYEVGGTAPEPALATECVPNEDLTVWTCSLREGVQFHDGSTLDANDVVMSFAVGLDASNEYHVGNTGTFFYWDYLWGLWNAPSE